MLSEEYAILISDLKTVEVDQNIYFGFSMMNV